MARPRKCRAVEMEPGVTFFKPQGIPLRLLEHAVITVDELEALRLSDFQGLTQEEVAQQMQVSRPTVTRMLARAHQVVADALVNGKAIRIEGGDYTLGRQEFRCPACGLAMVPGRGGEMPGFCAQCNCPGLGPGGFETKKEGQ